MVHSVLISTDAALPDTFEKLRRGWQGGTNSSTISDSLGRLRATSKSYRRLTTVTVHMSGLLVNFREMKDFVALSETVGADCAIFELLFPNSNAMTEIEYNERAVHLAGHPDHQEFLEIIADPIFQKNNVRSDFERPRRPTKRVGKRQSQSYTSLHAGSEPRLQANCNSMPQRSHPAPGRELTASLADHATLMQSLGMRTRVPIGGRRP